MSYVNTRHCKALQVFFYRKKAKTSLFSSYKYKKNVPLYLSIRAIFSQVTMPTGVVTTQRKYIF